MLPFKAITFDDSSTIEPFLSHQNYRTSDYTVAGIFMWHRFFNMSFCIVDEMLLIKMQYKSETPYFCIPVGPGSLDDALEALRNCCKEERHDLVFAAVPQAALSSLHKIFGEPLLVEENRDWFDYLYLADELRNLAGKKFRTPRNHINRFKRSYPDYRFVRITMENISLVRHFYSEYAPANTPEGEFPEAESAAVAELLDEYFDRFEAIGYYLEIKGQIAGFAIGEIINDTFFVHIEKASLLWHGSYQMLVNGVALLTPENIQYINREEDVGIEGLRKSKLSYNPTELLAKYTVRVSI